MKTLLKYSLLVVLALPYFLFAQPKYELVGVPFLNNGKDSSYHLDLGEIPNFLPSKRILTIKNPGKDTLIIKDVGASCGCTATLLSQDHIAPNDSGTLSITFDAKRFEGIVEKRITMRTNDTARSKVEIRLKANVITLLEIEPEYIFFKAVKDSTTIQTLTIKNVSKDKIKILSHKSDKDFIQSKISSSEIKPNETATITIECTPKISGTFNSNLEIKTDNEKIPQFQVRLFGWSKDKSKRS